MHFVAPIALSNVKINNCSHIFYEMIAYVYIHAHIYNLNGLTLIHVGFTFCLPTMRLEILMYYNV